MRQKNVMCGIVICILLLGLCGFIRFHMQIPPENSSQNTMSQDTSLGQEYESQTENLTQTEENTQEQAHTLSAFLYNALRPVGTTMYIWGGGWNEEDTGAGVGATNIGLYSKWKNFADKQNADYNYKEHRYEWENGLDCSGFVGWAVYNTFETENGKEGYVVKAKNMAAYFANKGWGHLVENPKKFLPGDIVSMEKHVWICLGTCEDGSVLLVHASPPGVSVCGTKGKAAKLAKQYMTEQHPEWQKNYPKREVSDFYMEDVTLFRWTKGTMSDTEEIQALTGEEVIKYLLQGE